MSIKKYGLQKNISLPLIFIDGLARCGKSAFSGIIPSLQKMEHVQFSTELELIISGLALQSIGIDYAKAFLRIYFNELTYKLHLSRNVNFRKNDWTGVDNYPCPQIYYERLKRDDGDGVIHECEKSPNSIPLVTHDLLVNMDLLDQLDLKYKLLSLWRNPIDNIYSWWMKGWGERFNNDPRGFTLLVDGGSELYPWYAAGFTEKLIDLNNMEKCVVVAGSLLERAVEKYQNLASRSKVHIFTFEEFCVRPNNELQKISEFLSADATHYTADFIGLARFPRAVKIEERQNKLASFKSGVRPNIYNYLCELNDSYQKNLYGLR